MIENTEFQVHSGTVKGPLLCSVISDDRPLPQRLRVMWVRCDGRSTYRSG